MSKATLKKALKDLDSEGLTEIILELYDKRPEAKEYLEFWISPDSDKEFEKYRQRLFKIFFMSEERPKKSPDFTTAKRYIKYFSSLYIEPQQTGMLMLEMLDIYSRWLSVRNRVLSHTERVRKMSEEIETYIEVNGLEDSLGIRFSAIQEKLAKIFERGDRRSYRGWRRWFG